MYFAGLILGASCLFDCDIGKCFELIGLLVTLKHYTQLRLWFLQFANQLSLFAAIVCQILMLKETKDTYLKGKT